MVTKKKSQPTPTKSKVIIDIEEANALVNWVPLKVKQCAVCSKLSSQYTVTASAGLVCRACCERAIENELKASQADRWEEKRIKKALSSQGPIIERLAVLTHMETLQHRMDLRPLLIDNLGFLSNHPMSQTVRQKAFDACAAYHHKRAMFRSLLAITNYGNWHQQVNVATLCLKLFPDDPSIVRKCQDAARQKAVGAKVHMARILCIRNEAWAQILWKELCLDVNPAVRKMCQDIANEFGLKVPTYSPLKNPPGKGGSKPSPAKDSGSKNEKVTFSKSEAYLVQLFPFQLEIQHKKIYTKYLKDLLTYIDPDVVGEKAFRQMSETSHSGFIKLLAHTLSDKMLFEALLSQLPSEVGLLLYICVWEDHLSVDKSMLGQLAQSDFQKTLDIVIPEAIKQRFGKPFLTDGHVEPSNTTPVGNSLPPQIKDFIKNINWDVELIQNPAFFLFRIERTWQKQFTNSGYRFTIHPFLKRPIKKLLPYPDDYHIVPVETVDEKQFDHHDDSGLFETLPAIMAFIDQDQLEFTKDGKKIKISSLNKMNSLCRIDEFYKSGPSAQRYLKTNLLANFFICGTSWDDAAEGVDIPGALKKRIQDYFTFSGYQIFRSRELLTHIKGQQEECDDVQDEMEIRSTFQTLLKRLYQDRWVSLENLAKQIKYGGLHFSPFTHQGELGHLKLDVSKDYFKKHGTFNRRINNNKNVMFDSVDPYDAVVLPLLRSLLFLFGALDMVALRYTEPKNDRITSDSDPYLTLYDGLSYVRLTDFGAYVLGMKKEYAVDLEKRSAEILVDEGRLTLSIIGEDPVKRLALDTVGRRMTSTSYRVDYESFLKDCSTPGDVKNRITYFRSHISNEPPPLWESFFQSVLARMEPFKEIPDMRVFKITPDQRLIQHLTTDPILKKHVIRAENYQVMVPNKAYAKVKKVLRDLGYFQTT